LHNVSWLAGFFNDTSIALPPLNIVPSYDGVTIGISKALINGKLRISYDGLNPKLKTKI